MHSISITIPLKPVAQMRARHTAIRSKTGRIFQQTYKAEKQVQAEQRIEFYLLPYQPQKPIMGPVQLSIRCYMPIPKSWSKKRRLEAAKENGNIRHIKKPDLSNLIKNIEDCMTAMHFWQDDCQICGYLGGTGKYYSDRPRWEIDILWE